MSSKAMDLSEYDQKIKPHLELIATGAAMAARHVRALPFKMTFTTHAQDELEEARKILAEALHNVIEAQAIYECMPAERSDAT